MASITKSQAEALAAGFLNNLGTNESLQPKETFTEFILIAGEFIEDAQNNLNRSNSIATGKLSASLKISEPKQTGKIITVDITMNSYGQFVNKGVKGTKSGQGKYRFKNDNPSRKMVKAIADWQKGGRSRSFNVKRAYGKNEAKNKAISQIDAAYAIARSIKQHGIKATGFIDKAIKTTSSKVRDRLGAAFKIDIINSIK